MHKKQYQFTQLSLWSEDIPTTMDTGMSSALFFLKMEDLISACHIFNLLKEMPKCDLMLFYTLEGPTVEKDFMTWLSSNSRFLKSEIQVMDDRKKDAIYELGCCFEAMGKKIRLLKNFKSVYSADISFRDVADKINTFTQTKTAHNNWRRGRDSNPRYLAAHPISSRAHSTTLPPLQGINTCQAA